MRIENYDELLSGKIDNVVLEKSSKSDTYYVAWTKTWEGPPRPDYSAALADLNDKLRINIS